MPADAPRDPPADADLEADVVRLHAAAEQDTSGPENIEKYLSPRRRNAEKSKNVKDISSDFRNAASGSSLALHRIRTHLVDLQQALETGQLVKDPYFTLFEAVGALEVRRTGHAHSLDVLF